MPPKRTSASPYPPSQERHRRGSLRPNSESFSLHGQPVVGKAVQQARPEFFNGSVNSSKSMLDSLSLPAKMVIESQRRVHVKENTNSRPSTPSNMSAPSAGNHADSAERPSSTPSSNTRTSTTSLAAGSYANATKASPTKHGTTPPAKPHPSQGPSIPSPSPGPMTRSKAQVTVVPIASSKQSVPPANDTTDEQWKVQKRVLERDLEQVVVEKTNMMRENETLRRRTASYEEKLNQLERALREEKTTSEALKMQVATIQEATVIISEEAHRAQKRCRELEDKNDRLQAEVQTTKAGSRELEEKRAGLQILLDARKQELKGLQVFLTATDTCSEADVIQLVASLNAEIFQTAAYISGLLEDIPDNDAEDLTWQQCLNNDMFTMIDARAGKGLVQFIGNRKLDNRRDPFPLQLALQAILVWWSSYMVNNFCDNAAGNELTTLYKHVREKESQAISARWRAITVENLAKFKQESYCSFIHYSILGILKMAGCSQNLPASKSATTIQESIGIIEKIWKQIRVAVKEGVISSDLELLYVEPGVKYDPANMEDYYLEDEGLATPTMAFPKAYEGTVLCPVAVGMRKSTIKSADGQYDSRSKQDVVLLKPKVVLVSALAHLT